MSYPIHVEGGITRSSQCDSCKTAFVYLFRVPQYPIQRFSFATREDELQWKQQEEQRIQDLLHDQHLLVRCPKCRALTGKSHHSLKTQLIEVLRSSNPFRSHEQTLAVLPLSLDEQEALQLYFRCVCEILYSIVRNKKESVPHFHYVSQALYQRNWEFPTVRSAWCEDIFWKIAILDQQIFSTPTSVRIDKLFQAVYLLNVLDNTVYPALPKKIMEFFSIDVLRASRLIQQLGEEAHRHLFHF